MAHVAQTVAKKNIKAFIERDPTSTVVTRRTFSKTSAGGKKWTVVGDLPAQSFRFVPARTINAEQAVRTTQDGRQVIPEWMVVGMPEADLVMGDLLKANGKQYEVVFKTAVPSWRTVYEVIENA